MGDLSYLPQASEDYPFRGNLSATSMPALVRGAAAGLASAGRRPARLAGATAVPDSPDESWWLAPLITTLLFLGATLLSLFCLGLALFAFGNCPSDGGCVAAGRHVHLALVSFTLSALFPLAQWVLPRRTRMRRLRGWLLLGYLLPAAATVALLLTTPHGR